MLLQCISQNKTKTLRNCINQRTHFRKECRHVPRRGLVKTGRACLCLLGTKNCKRNAGKLPMNSRAAKPLKNCKHRDANNAASTLYATEKRVPGAAAVQFTSTATTIPQPQDRKQYRKHSVRHREAAPGARSWCRRRAIHKHGSNNTATTRPQTIPQALCTAQRGRAGGA